MCPLPFTVLVGYVDVLILLILSLVSNAIFCFIESDAVNVIVHFNSLLSEYIIEKYILIFRRYLI